MRQTLQQDSFPAKVRRDPFLFRYAFADAHPNLSIAEANAQYDQMVFSKVEAEWQQERTFLDSIRAAGLISDNSYRHRRVNLFYDSLRHSLISSRANHLKPLSDEGSRSLLAYQGHHLRYHAAQEALQTYLQHIPAPQIRARSGSYPDFRVIFDSLSNHAGLAAPARDLLLYRITAKIIEHFSVDEHRRYLNRLTELGVDSSLVQQLLTQYRLDQPITSTLYLEDLTGSTDSLQGMLAAAQGQVLYVDF